MLQKALPFVKKMNVWCPYKYLLHVNMHKNAMHSKHNCHTEQKKTEEAERWLKYKYSTLTV